MEDTPKKANNNINILLKRYIPLIVFILILLLCVLFVWLYYKSIYIPDSAIKKIVDKFNEDGYKIKNYVAERYLIWLGMRNFYYVLHYFLIVSSMLSSLITVFFASNKKAEDSNEGSTIIVFFSMISLFFTICHMLSTPLTIANMSQHAWRKLDTAIFEMVTDTTKSDSEKDIFLSEIISEIENYIETFEH